MRGGHGTFERTPPRACRHPWGVAAVSTLVWLLCWTTVAARAWPCSPVFTEPECESPAYAEPVTSHAGATILGKRGNAYCTRADFQASLRSSPVLARLKQELRHTATRRMKRLTMAYYKVFSPELLKHLCQEYARHAYTLEIFVQAGRAERYFPQSLRSLVQQCFGSDVHIRGVGCDVFDRNAACARERLNTCHMKCMIAEFSDGSVRVVAGSGNLNMGMFTNFEDWLILEGRTNGPLHRWHEAMVELLRRDPESVSKAAERFQDDVGKYPESVWRAENVEPVLFPVQRERFYALFHEYCVAARAVRVTSQDFNDRRLLGALEAAVRNGADVQFVLDDDWYYSRLLDAPFGTCSPREIKELYEFAERYPNRVEVRYLETNQGPAFYNSVHHKCVIFELEEKIVVYTGAVNLSYGAIRHNMDNGYFLTDPEVSADYAAYYSRLATRAHPWERMPTRYVP